ncbi:MAG: HPF/RaiA family ribosome-associated protein [Bacteriovorax sp.]|nr:HPF/RaiA family ribosome-associated protein [Rhizobacter sp.]
MQIDIRPSNLALEPQHAERIVRRAGFALSRLASRIRRVEVRFADVNGPRGGVDKRCRVLLHLDRGDPMLVEERGSDLLALIDRVMDRVGRAVHKRLGIVTQARHTPRSHRSLVAA